MKIFFVFISLTISFSSFSQTAETILTDIDTIKIKSTILNSETYDLLIHFPKNYDKQKAYNTLYLLDGMDAFAYALTNLKQIKDSLSNFNEPLLICISDGTRIGDANNKRSRDFTPTKFTSKYGSGEGGAENFLKFISTEVMPAIESKYKTTTNKTLYGYSYGGLFASYVLFTRPELFSNILIGSPSIWVDNKVILKQFEPTYSKSHTDLNCRVWLSSNSEEKDRNQTEFVKALTKPNYPNLKLNSVVMQGYNHMTGGVPTMKAAFEWCFIE